MGLVLSCRTKNAFMNTRDPDASAQPTIVEDDPPQIVRCVRVPDGEVSPTSQCSICLDPFDQTSPATCAVRLVHCNHQYHYGCLSTWMRVDQSCPTCRTKAPVLTGEELQIPLDTWWKTKVCHENQCIEREQHRCSDMARGNDSDIDGTADAMEPSGPQSEHPQRRQFERAVPIDNNSDSREEPIQSGSPDDVLSLANAIS